jgi:hypothetical protein
MHRTEPRLAELTVARAVVRVSDVVAGGFERRNTALGLSEMRYADHDVDHGLCPEARNRRAPDVLDGRFTCSEYRVKDRPLPFESARPL